MLVQILGSGCDRCKKMAANAAEAAQKLGLPATIEKVTDIEKITAFGVMLTPALVINGKVVKSGKPLSVDEIATFLQEAAASTPSVSDPADAHSQTQAASAPRSCCGGADNTPDAADGKSAGCCATPTPTGGKSGCCGGGSSKKMLTWLLLAFVVFSLAMVIVRSSHTPETVAVTPTAAGTLAVYYFHGDQRCKTCSSIERLTRETVSQAFARELTDGRIAFHAINLDNRANEHYITDFALATRTVVIHQNGRFEHLDEVWTLTDKPEQFRNYIIENIRKMQEENHE